MNEDLWVARREGDLHVDLPRVRNTDGCRGDPGCEWPHRGSRPRVPTDGTLGERKDDQTRHVNPLEQAVEAPHQLRNELAY